MKFINILLSILPIFAKKGRDEREREREREREKERERDV
jgi:hypothetical protein